MLQKRRLPIVFRTSHAERSCVEKLRGITRYGYIIKNSGDFVLKSSIDMAFERYIGTEESLLLGKTDYAFYDGEAAEFFRGKDSEAIERGDPTVFEESVKFDDDGRRAARWTPSSTRAERFCYRRAGKISARRSTARTRTAPRHAPRATSTSPRASCPEKNIEYRHVAKICSGQFFYDDDLVVEAAIVHFMF
jgi:hypothetical protein